MVLLKQMYDAYVRQGYDYDYVECVVDDDICEMGAIREDSGNVCVYVCDSIHRHTPP